MASYWTNVACPKCGGAKEVQHALCNGNGYKGWCGPRCSGCGGTGLITCRRCKGFGEVRKRVSG